MVILARGNLLVLITTAVSCSCVIPVCDLLSWFSTGKISGEAYREIARHGHATSHLITMAKKVAESGAFKWCLTEQPPHLTTNFLILAMVASWGLSVFCFSQTSSCLVLCSLVVYERFLDIGTGSEKRNNERIRNEVIEKEQLRELGCLALSKDGWGKYESSVPFKYLYSLECRTQAELSWRQFPTEH